VCVCVCGCVCVCVCVCVGLYVREYKMSLPSHTLVYCRVLQGVIILRFTDILQPLKNLQCGAVCAHCLCIVRAVCYSVWHFVTDIFRLQMSCSRSRMSCARVCACVCLSRCVHESSSIPQISVLRRVIIFRFTDILQQLKNFLCGAA